MTTLENRRRLLLRRIRITGWTALSLLAVTAISFLTYFHIVFMAEREATLEVFRDDRITVENRDGSVVLSPVAGASSSGLLYFPGARVDPYSYAHPLVDVAASGVTVVIVDPLFNMALVDPRDLQELTAPAPRTTHWTLAGHSLGGVRACMLADHPTVTGLVLMASYCANDISNLTITVVQVLAANDGLIDIVSVAEAQGFLPPGTQVVTLEGANHASFGTYGPQPGDGPTTLSRADVRDLMTAVLLPVIAAR